MNQDPSPTPRVNWVAVVATLVLLFGWLAYSSYRWPGRPAPKVPPATATAPTTPIPPTTIAAAPGSVPAPKSPAVAASRATEEHAILENDNVRVLLTSYGAGIEGIEMKQHAVAHGTEQVVLNTAGPLRGPGAAVALPVFALLGDDEAAPFAQQADASRVVYTRTLANGMKLERTYALSPDKSQTLTLEETFSNPGKEAATLPAAALQIGTAGPLYRNDQSPDTGADWIGADGKFARETAGGFTASAGFLGFGARAARDVIEPPADQGPLQWAAVKNRFFVVLVQPDDPQAFQGLVLRPADTGKTSFVLAPAIQAAAKLPALTLAPGETKTRSYLLYAGPKDHRQLKALGRDEQAIMEYGWWGFMAIPLAAAMEWIHRYVPNYGWTIVLLTLALKALLWKFQSAANHSMKKMQALAPKQKELSDKYKEDPQRMQVETMKLYREYGVNPLGGCLPMLIQIPIFLGFYTMLRGAGQLQHQSWLWVKDLVQPDTVWSVALSFPLPVIGSELHLNPLPILMAFTQWVVMRLTPQPNAAAAPQMKIMQWMPFVMMCVLYNFAAALALYWTVNNLVSIAQTYRNLKKPVPVLTRVKAKAVPSWLKPKK